MGRNGYWHKANSALPLSYGAHAPVGIEPTASALDEVTRRYGAPPSVVRVRQDGMGCNGFITGLQTQAPT